MSLGAELTVLGAFAKLRKATISHSVCLSVCPHRTTPLPTDVFSLNLVFVLFFEVKTIQVSSKVRNEYRVPYVKTNIHFISLSTSYNEKCFRENL